MLRVRRPILVIVLNDCVALTNDTPAASNSLKSLARGSEGDRPLILGNWLLRDPRGSVYPNGRQ
jgi:hypothetical protein